MADDTAPELFDFAVGGKVRVIKFEKSSPLNFGVTADTYTFTDDPTHELTIYTIEKGVATIPKTVSKGHQLLEGYIKGKGTLAVEKPGSSKDTYYFEKENNYKEVVVKPGQTVHWTAPNDSDLVIYEMSDRNAPPPKPAAPPPPKASGRTAKLFLTSVAINDAQAAALAKLVGKQPGAIKVALIENAADPYPEPKPWVAQARKAIQEHGFDVEVIDLNKYKEDLISLVQVLRAKHVIWFGGGNSFYLNWLLHSTHVDEMLKRLVKKGVVYAGGSAGAIVAGPTLKYFEAVDDPLQAEEVYPEGLNFTDVVVVPHMDNDKYAKLTDRINQSLTRAGYKTVPLRDDQALLIDGDAQQVI